MILKNLDQIDSKEFEFTIIGAGPAGITLATTLAKKNKRILLIEAGGSNFSEKSQEKYDLFTQAAIDNPTKAKKWKEEAAGILTPEDIK